MIFNGAAVNRARILNDSFNIDGISEIYYKLNKLISKIDIYFRLVNLSRSQTARSKLIYTSPGVCNYNYIALYLQLRIHLYRDAIGNTLERLPMCTRYKWQDCGLYKLKIALCVRIASI